ncbi:hypothetical protein NDU88_007330 [Pleurodeles waltl]|uniref:Uncharacterized protein n=1 Tax=Pleurodeles waltl TaxID=8319 RepID=A0AAV7NUI9_PLEWA|nr:hypothetical protein NDU88_007330 [Pleurodeles waltl]
MSSGHEPIIFHFRVTVGSSSGFAPSPELHMATRRKTGRRRKETGETTSAVRQTEAVKEKRRKGAEGTARTVSTAARRKPAGRTTRMPAVQQDATEGQEAIRPNSGHALGRVWPQQEQHCEMYLVRAYKIPGYK